MTQKLGSKAFNIVSVYFQFKLCKPVNTKHFSETPIQTYSVKNSTENGKLHIQRGMLSSEHCYVLMHANPECV